MECSNPDSLYVQDCRTVQNNTHSIQTLTGQISKHVGALRTDTDFRACREKVDEAIQQASETQAVLARIREHQRSADTPGEKNNRRMMYQKLSDNLAITARVLEDVVRRFQTEGTRRPVSQELANADAAGGEVTPLTGAGLGLGLEEEMASQKTQALKQVDQDVRCLQKIYQDLATAAQESQNTFDSLEMHMASAAHDIERGTAEVGATAQGTWLQKLQRQGFLVGASVVLVVMVTSYLAA